MDELGAELGIPPRRVDLDVVPAGAFHLASGVPAEGHHPLLGLGDGLADLLVEPPPGQVVSIRQPVPDDGSRCGCVCPGPVPGGLGFRHPAALPGKRWRARRGAAGRVSACGSGYVGGDHIGSVPVQGGSGPTWSYLMVVRGSACEAASCTSRSGTPASSAAVMNACLSVCGPTVLVIPARRVARRTIRAAPWRSSRRPSLARKTGPSHRSPTARSMARAVRGASGIVTTLPPLAGDGERPVATFGAQRLDAGAGGLRNLQPVQGEQRNQRVLRRRAEARGDQQGTELVTVQAGRIRLIIQAGAADMGGR